MGFKLTTWSDSDTANICVSNGLHTANICSNVYKQQYVYPMVSIHSREIKPHGRFCHNKLPSLCG